MDDDILEVGAEPGTDTAEGQDEQNEEVETGESAEQQGEGTADTNEGQEPEQGAEENKDRGAHQTTLEERAGAIARKEIERFKEEQAEIERQTRERLEAEKKPFVDLTPEQSEKLEADYLAATERKLELQELFRLSDDPREKAQYLAEFRRTEKWIDETERWYADNETKKAEWKNRNEATQTRTQEIERRSRELETTAEVYRESKNIPQDVWDNASKWFETQLKGDKLLGAKFADAYRLQGNVGAVEFAYNYAVENMGKKAEEEKQKREESKTKLTPGVTSTMHKVSADPNLKKLYDKAQKSGSEEDFLAYVEAKRKAGV